MTNLRLAGIALTVMSTLLLGPACGPKLRKARPVSPEDIHYICGLVRGAEVTRGDAICIAGLAGLNLDPGELVVRKSGELGGGPTWIVEEVCNEKNPRCIGVAIRHSDGTIADTRYLYVFAQREQKR